MSKQKIVWTALPHGRVAEGPLAGRLRVSIVVSPRLTPVTSAEQKLGAPGHSDFHNWPKTLEGLKLQLRVGNTHVPLEILGKPDPALWDTLFPKDTFVEGFVFKDMSRVNLRSYAVRNVLGFVRRHYGNLATQAAGTHPTLLPWKNAHGGLKGMLGELGTRTQTVHFGDRSVELPAPGFDRFFDDKNDKVIERQLADLVFGPKGKYRAPVVGIDGQSSGGAFGIRVLPADWQNPAGGGADAALMGQFTTADEYSFYQANRFYRRSTPSDDELRMRRPDLKNVAASPAVPEFDFHRIVASLADTPQVLRSLGLVIDAVLPDSNPLLQALAANPNGTADGAMQVVATWANGHDAEADAYPRTAWRLAKQRFTTRARTSDHIDGLLKLEGTQDPLLAGPAGTANAVKLRSDFDLFQLDPDGAALKTTNYLLTAQNLVGKSLKPGSHGDVTYTTGERQPVAALRSGGLGVSRHGRAAEVARTAAAAALKNSAVEASAAESRKIQLFTEDVMRGLRVDVQHDGKWFSLCRREGEYVLVKPQQRLEGIAPDEGYVKGASTTGDGGDDHYLHEALFRWTGWSLVAQRPGRTLRAVEAQDGSGLQGESVADVDEVGTTGSGLAVKFKAERGTLPKLRFGETYRFRARVVDLAGNSLPPEDPGVAPLEQASEPVTYLRFEPVDPPALVHRHRVSEGESLERLVLRSNFDKSPAAYLEAPDFKATTQLPASADFEYVATAERHFVPPKSAQLQCEQHALFDAAFGNGTPGAIKAAYATAAREAGTLFDPLPSAQIELVTPNSVKDVALTTTVPPALPSPEHPTGERLVGGQYVVHREESVETPYLPDGAAGGVAIRPDGRGDFGRIGITQPVVLGPGCVVVRAPNEELVLLVKNGEDWPKTRGLRIVMTERAHSLDDGPCLESFPDEGLPKWDPAKRVLTFFVRKGHVVRLRYASFVDAQFIDHLGIPRWGNSAGERKFIEGMALMGVHWMLTPYRPLVLVHATQQPVCTPRLQKVSPQRSPGATYADLDAAVQLHGASTGKFEVVAEWTEWVDDLQQPAPKRVHCSARLSEIPLEENGANSFMLAAMAQSSKPPQGNVFGSSGNDRALGNHHDFGDTKFRLVRYSLEATTRFREYLPPALFAQRNLITRSGPPALETTALVGADTDPGAAVLFGVPGAKPDGTRVPSTAAPEVPRIVYAVPTFKWSQNLGADKSTQSSTRTGNGLRVYLERPWFSSGDGELLGVVLTGDGARFTDIPEAQLPYVTQWGLDPLFDSTLPKSLTRATDFGARVANETLPLLETGEPVHVVGHRVQWDAARKLWFCDIDIDTGASYMPFVRLALVRYQPHALAGAKISRVAVAEFAQLLPRRRAVLDRASTAVKVTLRGPVPEHGPMDYHNDSAHLNISFIPPPGTALETGRNKIELVLQTRDPNIDSDLAWSDVSTLASSLALPAGATIERVPGGPNTVPLNPRAARIDEETRVIFSQPAVKAATEVVRAGNLGQLQGFDVQVQLPSGGVVTADPDLFDPAVWEASVTLPRLTTQPTRLVLREFERYYSDRTIPDKRGDTTFRKRVVEERLVYSEFFPLN